MGRASGIKLAFALSLRFVSSLLIEILAMCFCGIRIPGAKEKDNPFVSQMKVALLHDIPNETWFNTLTSK